ncbi:class I SAM-dependent DNA methyltransferase [Carboxydothermus ferrireducens]|uniref:SAM-dependent methyltransferase n=1 Tax=Carboxydothermus ferrireducens DSM 11255 TaxID=1119529 RepID=A0ABX2RAB6_9THEO|nr:class I SAM-dependent methyltransferase [Carboxydothermus ferrireducens]NYE58109.1 SAM-dependent methyltransferase [Carboxydothermus ferrireducens DSM 11255]
MPYSKIANFYDLLLSGVPGDYWVQLIEDLLKRWNYEVKTIAELGCGTGVILEKLSKKGYKLYGVDISPEMLAVAHNKKIENTNLICQDIVNLELPEKVDLIFAFHDCLNYINSKDDLYQCFSQVKDNLNEQGLFYFDLNRLEWLLNLENIPGELHLDNLVLNWTGKFNNNKFFIKLRIYNQNTGEVSYEQHELSLFSPEEVLKLLADLNFSVLSVNHTPTRSFYSAVKGGSGNEC